MLRLHLVGSMAVDLDGVAVARPVNRRAWAVLAWLALHPGPQPRSRLAAVFWPDVPGASARASLRSAIWALRQSLGPSADRYLSIGRDRLGLRADSPLWVDTRALDDCIARGRVEDALALGRGVLLEEFEEEWVLAARDAYVQKIAGLLERMAQRAQDAGDVAAAVAWTRRQAELEPFSEVPVQRLMRRLAAGGDRAAALAAFDRFSRRLAAELRTTPAPQTQRLADELRGRRTGGGPRLGVPATDWPLIGRGDELDRLLAAWHTARTGRLTVVTITGEPGIGKTRLATELLAAARRDGGLVATATALDLGSAAPLGLWTELIGGLTSAVGAVPRDAGWPQALGSLVPALQGPLDHAAVHIAPELDRARLHEATVGMLDWASRGAPVALLLDDVLLADTPSLELTGYVCRRLADSPLLLLLVRRTLPHRVQVDALEHALRARRTLHTEILLGPLDAASVARLARAVAALPPRQVEQVADGADGNALLAVEWATALAHGVQSPPESLRAAVRMALVRLHGDALELSRFLAVAGRSLDQDEIAGLALSEDATDGVIECALIAAEQGCIGFRHALLREAACADLPEPVRHRLQTRLDQLAR